MSKSYLILLLLVFNGCRTKTQCEVDMAFRMKFDNCIKIMASRELGVYVKSDDLDKAVNCLISVTGKHSWIEKGNFGFYPADLDTIRYFCADLQQWTDWYRQKKCSMTMAKADSILAAEKITWPTDMLDMTDFNCIDEYAR